MKKILLAFAFISIFSNNSFSQADCLTAAPFCTASGTTFPASTSTTAAVGPDYGCLGSQPNPAWYYLNIATSGDIIIDLSNSAVVDIDFAAWGPFATQAAMCAGTSNSPFDCSFSGAATEQVNIIGAVAGEWYMVLITNFSGMPTNISATAGPGTTGSTNCAILCNMTAMTATPTACDSTTIDYDVSGTITYSNPPTTGTLVITNSCSGTPLILNPPFPPTSMPYSFTGLPANGSGCTITALFTADSTCTFTQTYTAPPPCTTICNISSISTATTPCDPLTNSYDLSGNVTFINQPTTGTLTITNSCGGAPLVFNPPFISPIAYNYAGLTANGGSCSINAIFSADPACVFTQTYTAVAACTTCPVTATNNGPVCEGTTLNLFASTVTGATYSWTGPSGFTSTLQNPVIPASAGTGGNYTVTVTTVSPPCSASSTTTFILNPAPLAIVSSDQFIYYGDATIIYASGGSSYSWNPTTSLSCPTCDSTIASPATTTDYCVTVGDLGCFDSNCVKVNVVFPCPSNRTMEVPNAFSPNGDAVNEELCLFGWDDCINSFQIMIFDRWGEKLYQSTDPDFCWNGMYKGKLLDPGVYVYFIKAMYDAEGATPIAAKERFSVTKNGNITLLR